jgi:O-antigen/teichoic acid export membrane protein
MFRKLLGLLSDSATYGAGSLIGQVLGFLLLRVYTEYLDTAQYGVIGMLSIVTLLFAALSNLGMTNAIFRRFSLSKDITVRRTVLGTGLASVIASSLALMIILLLAAEPIAQYVVGDVDTANLVRLSAVSATIAGVGIVPRVVLRASRRVRTMTLLNLAQVVLTAIATIWFVVVQELGVLGFVLGTLVGELLGAMAAFLCTRGSFQIGFDRLLWREMLSYGLPFVPHYVQGTALVLFGQYMVRNLLGLDEAGLYNVATKFALPVAFVVNAVQTSWTAYKFEIHAEDDDPRSFFRSTFTYYVAGVTYLWVGVAAWGPEMVRLMTTEGFHDAARLVWVVSLVPLAHGIYFMSGTGMELSNDTRPFPLISLVGLITVVAGAFTLVPLIGAMGAAVATVLGFVVMSGVTYYFAQRRMAIQYDWPTIGCFALLAAVFVAMGCMVQDMPLGMRVACALAISLTYPLAAFLVLLRSSAERHRMRIIWEKIARAASARRRVRSVAEAPAASDGP